MGQIYVQNDGLPVLFLDLARDLAGPGARSLVLDLASHRAGPGDPSLGRLVPGPPGPPRPYVAQALYVPPVIYGPGPIWPR